MLTLTENKSAPKGNVAQWRGKRGGVWSALPISDEELVRRYQAGSGVKALAKQLGTNHVKILRRIRATCGVIKRRLSRHKGETFPGRLTIAGKSLHLWQKDAWRDEWKSVRAYDEQEHWGSLWSRSREYARAKELKHRKAKTNYYISKLLRHRIWVVLKGVKKSKPTLTMLGCTLEQFRQHMQAQFKRGMAWNNMGSHWHIDHIIPCSSFDLSNPEQQAICFHYTNMQPLEAFRNRKKHAKITDGQMKLRL